jgi:hypothetical protein
MLRIRARSSACASSTPVPPRDITGSPHQRPGIQQRFRVESARRDTVACG